MHQAQGLGRANGDGSYTLTSKDGSRREFDSKGLLTARIDANENVTQYNYTDGDGDTIEDEISQIVDPYGRTRGFAYTAGRLTTVTDTAGRATTIAYNPDGTLASVTSPDPDGPLGPLAAPIQTFGYDATTRLMTSWTNPLSQTTQFAHDAALRLVQEINPNSLVAGILPKMSPKTSRRRPVSAFSI